MRKELSGWQLFAIFLVAFVAFTITHSVFIAIFGDIVGLAALIVGVRNHVRSHREERV